MSRQKTEIEVRKRREAVAAVYFEGWSINEIVRNSASSFNTIKKDVLYILEHIEEFY